MNWAFRIARVRGIDIKIHISFFLILALGAFQWADSVPGNVLEGALFGVVLMILLFACVTLHELGHSIAAQGFGIPVREIVLLPLGGVALISKNPEKPLHELIIAAAGPLVNVVIAIILFVVTGTTVGFPILDGQGVLPNLNTPSLQTMLVWLLAANVSLVVFNLIPAFPLDGGRIFRAILAMFMGYPRATRIASTVGQIAAIGLGILGIATGNFILALVAVFIFFGAGQENAQAESKTVLTTLKVGDAYNKHALNLQIGDRVSKVVDYILTSYQPDFAVLQGSNLIGIVTREDVLRTLATDGNDKYVTEIMQREVAKVDAAKSLDEARQSMGEQGQRVAAVYDGAKFLGLVSAEDIGEAFAVLTFVQRQQSLRGQRAA
jgi:Zn-dependent protease/predicted transcriptional regulator